MKAIEVKSAQRGMQMHRSLMCAMSMSAWLSASGVAAPSPDAAPADGRRVAISVEVLGADRLALEAIAFVCGRREACVSSEALRLPGSGDAGPARVLAWVDRGQVALRIVSGDGSRKWQPWAADDLRVPIGPDGGPAVIFPLTEIGVSRQRSDGLREPVIRRRVPPDALVRVTVRPASS